MGLITEEEFSTQSYCSKFLGFCPITSGEKNELRKLLNKAGHNDLAMFSLSEVEEIIERDLPVVLVDTTYVSDKGLVPEKKWVEVPSDYKTKISRRERKKSSKRMIISIPGGNLYIDEAPDMDNYPGVDIEFVPFDGENERTYPRVLIERARNEEDGSFGPLRALIWNGDSEDYTDEIVFDYPLGGTDGKG